MPRVSVKNKSTCQSNLTTKGVHSTWVDAMSVVKGSAPKITSARKSKIRDVSRYVLMGRGGASNTNPGNIAYLHVIERYKPASYVFGIFYDQS